MLSFKFNKLIYGLWLILILSSCGTHNIDEKYAAEVVKDKLSIPGSVSTKKLSGGSDSATNFFATDGIKKYVIRFTKKILIANKKFII